MKKEHKSEAGRAGQRVTYNFIGIHDGLKAMGNSNNGHIRRQTPSESRLND